ncbi:MAG: DUF882 domain-containing protein [Gemmatimonadaceae bacterium]|nr:DUF882 domain-containing protein [Gemmatimonadaceae bacterium]
MQDIPLERRIPALGVHHKHQPKRLVSLVVFLVAAIGAVQFANPVLERRPFAMFMAKPIPQVEPSADAFGTSGEVLLKFSMPGREVEYPLAVHGDPAMLSYEWIRLGSEKSSTAARPLRGDKVVSPMAAGFYRLRLVRGDVRRLVDGLTLAVLVPFGRKEGDMLNGYRIGTYLGERLSGRRTPPEGFLEITQADLGLQITKHLKVSDFLTHDSQDAWPKYAAVSPRLLDKLELVIAEISSWRGSDIPVALDMDVHSGFRSPDHNRQVRRAARDSQHQYGDAADVTIDANGDGRISVMDSKMVGLAVEIVELKHPELVGGLGLYTSRRSGSYVHIDARGQRVRWRG